MRETVDHKGYWRSLIRNSHFFVSRWAINQGTHSHEGASVTLRPPQSTWANKMDAAAAILRNCLTKLPTPVLEIGHVTTPSESSYQPAEVSVPTAEDLMTSIQP